MLQRMKLGTKLLLGFFTVALITLGLGIIGYYGAIKAEKSVNEIGAVRLPGVDSLLVIKGEAEAIRGTMRTLALPGLSADVRQRQYDNLKAARQVYEAAWKKYESLPHTPEEAELWKDFVPAWNAWRAENNTFMELMHQMDALGVSDPMLLGRQVESFTKDHYRLVQQVLSLVFMNQSFEGGDDHTACAAGRWMAAFKTDNPDLIDIVKAMQGPHQRFHEAVKSIQAAHGRGDAFEMKTLYTMELSPAMFQVFQHFSDMLRVSEQGIALLEKGRNQLLGPLRDTQNKALALLDQIVEINQRVAAHEVEAAHGQATFLELVSLIAAIVGVVLAMGLGFFIARGISRTLIRISQGMSEGANQVASASGQVSSSSQSMAEGASQQAASIEETSSSMEEMASMTKRNAENAGNADGLMREANQIVQAANASMGELTRSMQEISKASEETSKIIKTIDEIAFQTNLLALNAAVEAARAGEAGAGFAVVADEVRNLAMRAATAAKDTAQLIEGTVKKVNDGSHLVSTTNEAFSKVAESAGKVGTLIAEISQASKEQSNGIDQVNLAITEMDKVVQQNAANAEESASAAEEMSAQAEQLKEYVDELVLMVTGRKSEVSAAAKVIHHHVPSLAAPKGAKKSHPAAMPGRRKKLLTRTLSHDTTHDADHEDFKDF